MPKTFNINITTSEKTIYEGRISSLIAPSEMGYLGVLADHAPLVANLASGRITLREPSGRVEMLDHKGKGFLEVLKNNVTILLSES